MRRKILLKSFFFISLLMFSMNGFMTSCGSDEPEISNEQVDDENSEEQIPDNPESEPPSDDNSGSIEVNEEDTSKFFTPKNEDLLGPWYVYWEMCEDWECRNGKWVKTRSKIWTEEDSRNWHTGFPYYLALFEYSWGGSNVNKLIWDSSSVYNYNSILSALENKESANFGSIGSGIQVSHGDISGDYFKWEWYPNIKDTRSMLVLLEKNKNVRCRWEISKFDGETFTLTDFFDDWRNSKKDGSIVILYERKYRRITNAQ